MDSNSGWLSLVFAQREGSQFKPSPRFCGDEGLTNTSDGTVEMSSRENGAFNVARQVYRMEGVEDHYTSTGLS